MKKSSKTLIDTFFMIVKTEVTKRRAEVGRELSNQFRRLLFYNQKTKCFQKNTNLKKIKIGK